MNDNAHRTTLSVKRWKRRPVIATAKHKVSRHTRRGNNAFFIDRIAAISGAIILSLLILSLSSSWLWPRPTEVAVPYYVDITDLKEHAQCFTAATLSLCALSIALAVLTVDFWGLSQIATIFLPILIVSSLSSMFSSNILRALEYLSMWTLIVSAGIGIGAMLRSKALFRMSVATTMICVFASIFSALIFPKLGAAGSYANWEVWNGIFEQKQVLGWFLTTTILIIANAPITNWLRLTLIVLILPALYYSHSASAQIISFIGVLYSVIFIPYLKTRKMSLLSKFTVTLLPLLLLASFCIAMFSRLTSMLGRDGTLEARTVVWPLYLSEALKHPVIGTGPGSYTGGEINSGVWLLKGGWFYSTHNNFITVFGETGLLGLSAFVFILIYIFAAFPYLKARPSALTASAIALQLIAGGMVEPTISFFPSQISLSIFLMTVFFAAGCSPPKRLKD